MSVTVDRTTQRYSSGEQDAPRMVLLHTTEGWGWPSYGGGGSAPHATIKPLPGVGIEVREHIPFGQFGKALANRAGGVQTNTTGVLQFELMGTCDESRSGLYFWPNADDQVLAALADYLRPIMRQYGIPHTSDVTWKDYNAGRIPSSYGLSNGVRMSHTRWMTFRGICGHQHAPENDHGDPGNFPIDTLLRHLGGTTTTTSQEDDTDMASLSDIAAAVRDGITAHWSESVSIPGETKPRTRNQILIWGYTRAGAAARDSQKALAVARAVARRQGLTDDQLDDIEDKVDRLIDRTES
ncbi:hypothetical protein [Janibacter terrae]|uniref:hypothetical protein n=1 Tax=Janibacter terrae TaxID=103817 RepID=UPI00082E80C7|nr:hypothetical protein [Janibacter terrae]